MSFANDSGKSNYFREVKLWINKLITEIKRTYPSFKSAMKEIFTGS